MRMAKRLILFFSASIAMLCHQRPVLGCSCAGWASVCQAYTSAESIFIGTVTRVKDVPVIRTYKTQSLTDLNAKEEVFNARGWKIYIEIEKTYKGEPQKEIVLAREDNSCSGKFEIGARLLLYAHFNKELGMWEIPPCNRNVFVSDAAEDLLFLEGLPKSLGRTRLSGELSRNEDTPEKGFTRISGFAGAKVKIAGKNKTYEAVTDKNGVYEIYDLPPDQYTVTPEVPPGLKIRFPMFSGFGGLMRNTSGDPNSAMINLKENGCVSVSFVFNANNSISGKVISSNGMPMKGVCMDLIPLADKVSKYFHVFDCTEEDGSYALKDMPPGKYLIVVNKDSKISSTEPFPTLYYPNTFEKEKATIIDMGEGDVRENYVIHLPAQSETITAEGVFLYSDGKPVIKEFVEFIADTKQAKIDGNSRARTDSQGHFSIKILKGVPGKLYGKMFTYIGQLKTALS